MKKYKNLNVECIKLIIDYDKYDDFVEDDYDLIAESINNRDWNLFNKLRIKYEKRGMIFDEILHCKFEEYGDFIYLKLDEELFNVITWIEVLAYECLDYYLD